MCVVCAYVRAPESTTMATYIQELREVRRTECPGTDTLSHHSDA